MIVARWSRREGTPDSPSQKRGLFVYSGALLTCLLFFSTILGSVLLTASKDVHAAGLPSPWAETDIGTVGVAGSSSYNNGTFTNTGSGIVEYTYDKFHFIYQPLYGDGTIIARVSGLTGGTGSAKAGVMIRSDLSGWPPAVNAYAEINASGSIAFQRRLVAGNDTSYTNQSGTYNKPYWLKLTRSGNTFTASSSADGQNWTQIGSDTINNMALDAWVGLAVTSGNDSQTTSATFDNVSVTQPTVNLNVDWNNNKGNIANIAYGTNAFSGLNVNIMADPNYNNAMTTMKPGSLRLHYAGLLNDSGSDSSGWVNTASRTWDANRIKTILDGVDAWKNKGYQPTVLINIPGFPSWLSTYSITDPNNNNAVVTDGLLNSSQFDAYAAFCADLVRIVNIDQGRGIKYFEVPNENDHSYNQRIVDYNKDHGTNFGDKMAELATLYNKAAVAMKNVDSSILVGGPALERPDTINGVKNFINNTANQSNPVTLDFLSMHGYASGSASDSDTSIYNRVHNPANNGGTQDDNMKDVRTALDNASPGKHIPLWFDENNISWTYQTYDERMKNYKGVVYDALAMTYFLSNGTDVLNSWNDADGIYGKIDPYSNPTFQLRPGGQFLQLMNLYGVGTRVATTTDTENTIVPFAIKTANGYSYLITNRSPNPRQVNTTFAGGPGTSAGFTQNQFSASGLSTTTVSNINSINVPPFSVTLLTSTGGSSGQTLFSTGFESGNPQPTWVNTIDTNFPGGNIANVGGICCSLSGPEVGVRGETTHAGGSALMYSGADNSTSTSYAYAKVYDLSGSNIRVGSTTKLSYWIYPQNSSSNGLVSGSNSTCVAVDLIFTDGTALRDSGARDQNGHYAHPGSQCANLTLNSWNNVIVNLGSSVNGKTINRLNLGYDQGANSGGYRGYVDDIRIYN